MSHPSDVTEGFRRLETGVAARISQTMEDLRFLRDLKKQVDPASCMSIGVRRGVPWDDADYDDDDVRRPWRTFSFTGLPQDGTVSGMYNLIDLLIADRMASLEFLEHQADEEIAQITNARKLARLSRIPLATDEGQTRGR